MVRLPSIQCEIRLITVTGGTLAPTFDKLGILPP